MSREDIDMDALDFLKPKTEYFLTGSYRKTLQDSPQYFDYSIVDRPSKSFSEVINNLITTKMELIIRTMWDCDFIPNGYIVTQDGKMWIIQEVQTDDNNGEVLWFSAFNPMTEFIITLLEVDNPRGLK